MWGAILTGRPTGTPSYFALGGLRSASACRAPCKRPRPWSAAEAAAAPQLGQEGPTHHIGALACAAPACSPLGRWHRARKPKAVGLNIREVEVNRFDGGSACNVSNHPRELLPRSWAVWSSIKRSKLRQSFAPSVAPMAIRSRACATCHATSPSNGWPENPPWRSRSCCRAPSGRRRPNGRQDPAGVWRARLHHGRKPDLKAPLATGRQSPTAGSPRPQAPETGPKQPRRGNRPGLCLGAHRSEGFAAPFLPSPPEQEQREAVAG